MTMKGCLVGLSKLLLGVTLALVLLSLAGVATARYFMAQLSVMPAKPIYGNDGPAPTAIAPTEPAPVATAPTAPPPAQEEPDLEIPPGGYEAVVTQPIGLVLRAGPGADFERLGGIDNNTAIIVLTTSDDGEWLNIRLQSGQEGWVKGGNTRRL